MDFTELKDLISLMENKDKEMHKDFLRLEKIYDEARNVALGFLVKEIKEALGDKARVVHWKVDDGLFDNAAEISLDFDLGEFFSQNEFEEKCDEILDAVQSIVPDYSLRFDNNSDVSIKYKCPKIKIDLKVKREFVPGEFVALTGDMDCMEL